MRKVKVIQIFLLSIFLLIGCSNATTTANSISPKTILKSNPQADIFIMDNTVYINASEIDWVEKLALKEGKLLGKINKTGVKTDFKNWNATKLKIGTTIYELEGRKDIVLIKVNDEYIPFLKFVEG